MAEKYLRALAPLPVRAIATHAADFMTTGTWWVEAQTGLSSSSPTFSPGLFTAELASHYVNVVCGFGDEFRRLYTHDVVNVAITAPNPRLPNGSELSSLMQYIVYTPTYNDACELRRLGLRAKHVPPEGLKEMLKKIGVNECKE